MQKYLPKSMLSLAILTAIVSGCGGGGGSGYVKPSPSLPVVVPPTGSPNPIHDPVVVPPTGSPNPIHDPVVAPPTGSPKPINYQGLRDYSNAKVAYEAGFTGEGVTVGILEKQNGFMPKVMASGISLFDERLQAPPSLAGDFNPKANFHGTKVAAALGSSTIGIAPKVVMMGGVRTMMVKGKVEPFQDALNQLKNLKNQGIRIVNHSYGITRKEWNEIANKYPNLGTIEEQAIREAGEHQNFVDNHMLMVWATGNDGLEHPNVEASLPRYLPSLQQGWMAVTAINTMDSSNGKAGEISNYANKCSDTKHWCLAAPGDFYLEGIPNIPNYRVNGTSFAAPVVTAVAALVQQAYPWMKGTHLRQTLLSTANRSNNRNPEDGSVFDDKGPNKVYGWGIVDAGKAVKGPSLFMKQLTLKDAENKDQNFIADFENKDTFGQQGSVFSNDISGDAGLIKKGGGTLVLAGNNTYEGSSDIEEGILEINGSVVSDVNIIVKNNHPTAPAGTLSGTGVIGGDVHNAGTLINGTTNNELLKKELAGNEGLKITGNYTINHDAIHVSDVAVKPLEIGGKAKLDNQAHLKLTNRTQYVTQDGHTHTVLTTTRRITGQFSPDIKTDNNLLFKATADYSDHKKVNVTLTRNDVKKIAQASLPNDPSHLTSAENLERTLQALDRQIAHGQANTELLRNATAFQRAADVTTLAHSLDSLSGQIYASAPQLTFQQSGIINRSVSHRLAQAQHDKTSGVWFNGIGASGQLRETGFASANTRLSGSQLGIDWGVNPQTVIGASVTLSEGHANFDRFGGRAKSRHTGASVYGRYDSHHGTYLATRLGAATVKSEVNREILLGAEVSTALAKHQDKMFSTYLEVGQAMAFENHQLIPFVGISLDRLKRGAFTEKGNSFALTAQAKTHQHLASTLGLRMSHQFDWVGGKTHLQGYLGWERSLNPKRVDFEASFTGLPDATHAVQGLGFAKQALTSGLGLSTTVNQRWGWFVNYDFQSLSGGAKNHALGAGVKIFLK